MVNCAQIIKSKPHCIRETHQAELPLEEKASIIIFVNKKNELLVEVKIDDCLLTKSPTVRCDFMVQHKDINHYVELKGTDYEHALKQLCKSIEIFNSCFPNKSNKKCKAIIVLSKSVAITWFAEAYKESDLRKYVDDGICEYPIIKTSPYPHPLS